MRPYPFARVALVLNGVAMMVFYPLYMLVLEKPEWVWDYPARLPAMEHMLVAIYVSLGAFLVWAARDPVKALPLIDFAIVSGAIHGATMAWNAATIPEHAVHLAFRGDVMGTFLAPVTLALTHPRRFYLFPARATQVRLAGAWFVAGLLLWQGALRLTVTLDPPAPSPLAGGTICGIDPRSSAEAPAKDRLLRDIPLRANGS